MTDYYSITKSSLKIKCTVCSKFFYRQKAFLKKKSRNNTNFFCNRNCFGIFVERIKTVPDIDCYEIDKNNCWNWKLWIEPGGYGQKRYKLNGKKGYLAHRYFYQKYRGNVPSDKFLDHLCRNRKCVNPDHLEIVEKNVNTQRGLTAKLNKEKVLEIRKQSLQGKSQNYLARMFNVCQGTIWQVVNNISWKNYSI